MCPRLFHSPFCPVALQLSALVSEGFYLCECICCGSVMDDNSRTSTQCVLGIGREMLQKIPIVLKTSNFSQNSKRFSNLVFNCSRWKRWTNQSWTQNRLRELFICFCWIKSLQHLPTEGWKACSLAGRVLGLWIMRITACTLALQPRSDGLNV